MKQDKLTADFSRIGLFDSGVGGLSILRYLQEKSVSHNQNVEFVYLGDTGRCPYGDRSPAEISMYVEQIVTWLNCTGVDRIVMACNTSAAVAAPLARRISKVPVHDLISSSARFAASNFASVGIIATSATCKSKAFSQAIKAQNPQIRVCEMACPDLVPLVEQGLLSGSEIEETIAKYVKRLKDFNIDSLIFGCTHFTFLESVFRKQLPDSVSFIDPALHLGLEVFSNTATDLILSSSEKMLAACSLSERSLSEHSLSEHSLSEQALRESEYQQNTYFCTGDLGNFGRAAEFCLRLSPGSLKNSINALTIAEMQNSGREAENNANAVSIKNPFFRGSTSTFTQTS